MKQIKIITVITIILIGSYLLAQENQTKETNQTKSVEQTMSNATEQKTQVTNQINNKTSEDKINKTSEKIKILPQIIVTGSRFGVNRAKSGITLDYIDEKDLKNSGAFDLVAALSTINGLRVTRNGYLGGNSSFFIRGLDSKYAKILINGVLIKNAAYGSSSGLENISILQNIDHIEILKGGMSSLYGSDSFAGVINIITKEPSSKLFNINFNFEGGSASTFKENLNINGKLKLLEYNLNAVRVDSKGLSTAADTNKIKTFDKDAFHNTDLNLDLILSPLKRMSIKSSTAFRFGSFSYDKGAFADSITNKTEENSFLENIVIKHTPVNFLKYSAIYQFNYLGKTNTDEGYYGNSRHIGKKHFVNLQANLLLKKYRLSLGADYTYETYGQFTKTTTSSTNQTIGIYGQFAQDNSDFFNYSGGMRADYDFISSNWTYTGTGSLAIILNPVKFSFSIGNGHRSPTASEKAYNSIGSLGSEKSVSIDGGVLINIPEERLSMRVSGFYNKINNMILWNPTQGMFGDYDNYDFKSIGIETTMKYHPSKYLTVSPAYTYTKSLDPVSSKQSLKRPVHKADLNVNLALIKKRLNINFTYSYVDDTFDYSGNKLPGYNLIDSKISFQVIESLGIYIRAENLLNTYYYTTEGYSTPGRSFYGGLNFKY